MLFCHKYAAHLSFEYSEENRQSIQDSFYMLDY